MDNATLTREETRSEGILAWRAEQLEAAGYPSEDALRLAERTDIDLHLATDLLRDGCATHTALRILL